MKVIVFVKADKDSEAGVMPNHKLLAQMGAFNEELAGAGVLLAGDGLQPTSKGKRVKFAGNERTVIDGPFDLADRLIAGFWVWKVASMDEAVAWARRCPNPMPGESELEIRPVFEADDFGEAFSSELRQREEKLRSETKAYERK